MFLRELESEVLENVALGLLIARYLQRDFRILSPSMGVNFGPSKRFVLDFDFSYSAALNAAHK